MKFKEGLYRMFIAFVFIVLLIFGLCKAFSYSSSRPPTNPQSRIRVIDKQDIYSGYEVKIIRVDSTDFLLWDKGGIVPLTK